MRVIHFSEARAQFKQVIDQVVADQDVTIITINQQRWIKPQRKSAPQGASL